MERRRKRRAGSTNDLKKKGLRRGAGAPDGTAACSTNDLKKKGLRRVYLHESTRIHSSTNDLKKKGLRQRILTMALLLGFDQRPEKEGIKTPGGVLRGAF